MAPALVAIQDAGAVRAPSYLNERPLETASGDRARLVRLVRPQPTLAGAAAWKAFTAQYGSWQGQWDTTTGVPVRVWGEGIATPGASADAAVAERAARRLLAEQLGFVAPGTKLEHWQLVANVVHGRGDALRTVAFAQVVDGVPVDGAGVSFLWKRDRMIMIGSSAVAVTAARPTTVIDDATARAQAVAWIARAYGATPTVLAVSGPVLLPIARDGATAAELHATRVVTVDLVAPRARWDVYVDAATGAPIARRQLLAFATGTLSYDTPVRRPGAARQTSPAVRASITANGQAVQTSDTGGFTTGGGSPIAVVATVTGPRVRVVDDGGAAATTTLSIPDGGSGVWSAPANERVDAQLTAFVHASRMKSYTLAELNPSLGWLSQQQLVTVNEGGSCNAYSDGDGLHFLVADGGCENTARLPDVVYHEFGHSLHRQSIIPSVGGFDSALSEGVSDYLAATTTGDAGMGRGFFVGQDTALRHIDPTGGEYVWPTAIASDPHATGLIIAGALWDLRTALIARDGAAAGKAKADDLFYAILRRASDIPTSYPEVLAADDDDGNLANGTPNQCLIDAAFGTHGLVGASSTFGVGRPTRDGLTISLDTAGIGGCAAPNVAAVALVWRPAGGVEQAMVMTASGTTFSSTIPTQPEGTVVEYRVTVTLAGGANLRYPDNPGEQFYEFYVGPLIPVYCTDFETDPFAAGWSHRAGAAADDWQWGTANGDASNGDPDRAASGTSFVGTDLRGNGTYAANSVETLSSPTIDVRGYTGVRLQFRRWLTVEDGFFDEAGVSVDGTQVWMNFAGPDEDSHLHTLDREWREVDFDLEAAAADGSVQVDFRLATDGGLHFGGWNIDDFCIMARATVPVEPVCGNGTAETGEGCDDGNLIDGDGCAADCTSEVTVEDPGGCCSTGSDPRGAALAGIAVAAAIVRRRRRGVA